MIMVMLMMWMFILFCIVIITICAHHIWKRIRYFKGRKGEPGQFHLFFLPCQHIGDSLVTIKLGFPCFLHLFGSKKSDYKLHHWVKWGMSWRALFSKWSKNASKTWAPKKSNKRSMFFSGDCTKRRPTKTNWTREKSILHFARLRFF